MAVVKVLALRVGCDHVSDDHQVCLAKILIDNFGLTEDQIRVAAGERGWACTDDGDLCPSHRSVR